jgi:hypothetical protein
MTICGGQIRAEPVADEVAIVRAAHAKTAHFERGLKKMLV